MDKKKVLNENDNNSLDKQFLEKNGVSALMKDVISKIIQNRPDDPIIFLADYFEAAGAKCNRLVKALQQIMLTHYSKPAFDNNLRISFNILCSSSGSKSSKSFIACNGVMYMDLLNKISKQFNSIVAEKLLKKIEVKKHEVVVFETYRSGVLTCLMMADYLKMAAAIYELIDIDKTNKVERSICDTIKTRLISALEKNDGSTLSILESCYQLSPNVVYNYMSQTKDSCGTERVRMYSCDDFINCLADPFLLKINLQSWK